MEDQISYLLGGIQVVYIEELQPVLTLEEYYSLLDMFYNRLLKSRIPFHPRSLRGLQMILNRLVSETVTFIHSLTPVVYVLHEIVLYFHMRFLAVKERKRNVTTSIGNTFYT